MFDKLENAVGKIERILTFIDKLSRYPCWMKPTLEELGMDKSDVQAVFREKRKENFKGDVIDYLCLIHTRLENRPKIFIFAKEDELSKRNIKRNLCRLLLHNMQYFIDELGPDDFAKFLPKYLDTIKKAVETDLLILKNQQNHQENQEDSQIPDKEE